MPSLGENNLQKFHQCWELFSSLDGAWLLQLKYTEYNKMTIINRCDPGFTGPFCVPGKPLPMELHDDFNNDEPDGTKWREIYGGDTSDMCGHLVSGNALVFHKVWNNIIQSSLRAERLSYSSLPSPDPHV